MSHLFDRSRGIRVGLLLAALGTGAACASVPTIDGDDRPPVVVSSGSIVIDPTTGTFEEDGNDKKWKNKGKKDESSPVRFEVTVVNGTCTTASAFSGTQLLLYAQKDKDAAMVTFDIHKGNLRVASEKDLKQPQKGGVVTLTDWTPKSFVVAKGTDRGTTCGLTPSTTITIRQKSK